MSKKWFALSVEQLEKKLKTNAATGLSRKAARSRCAKDIGKLYCVEKKGVFQMLLEIVSDFALVILTLVAAVSLFFDEIFIGITVLALVALSVVFSLFIYHRSVRTRESVDKFFEPTAKIIREGKLFVVDYSQVVPGDVILLEAGDLIECDARLIRSESLTVKMRLDKNNVQVLEKAAEAPINANDNNVLNMHNMIHAGSVVTSGSARAIVTDVGRYTYLSALTGGIKKRIEDELPEELIKIKKIFSQISMALLVAVLPICTVSLLMSNIRGGKVFLSEAFLLSVALAAMLSAQKACTVFSYFYVYFLRRSVANQNPSVVRSVDTLNKLSRVDYLFLLDGSALTDGIYHYRELLSVENDDPSDKSYLSELIFIYRNSERRAISAGISESEEYYRGLDDFLSKYPVDIAKINIKYSVQSYSSLVECGEKVESISFSAGGDPLVLKIHRTPYVISKCRSAVIGGRAVEMSDSQLYEIENRCIKKMLHDDRLLVFTVARNGFECFVGALVFSEGKDEKALKSIQALEKSGTKVIVFADCNTDTLLPKIPENLYRAPCVKVEDFVEKNLPVTYQFGSFSTYCGMNEKQILSLVEYAHAKNKTVAVVGFSDFAAEVINVSDVFVTCAPVVSSFSGYFDEEIKSMEINGLPSSVSCKQIIKDKADIIISRPLNGRGGLFTLLRSFGFIKYAKQNLCGFFRFSSAMLAVRLLVTLLPMLMGNIVLDARHLLFFTVFIDIPVFLVCSSNSTLKLFNNVSVLDWSFKDYLKREKNLLISITVGVLSICFLPYITELFGGQYFYNVEYHFVSALLLQFFILYHLIYGNIGRILDMLKNKIIIIAVSVGVILVLIMFWIDPIGNLLGLQKNPLIYVLLSFVPSLISCGVLWFLNFKSKRVRVKVKEKSKM